MTQNYANAAIYIIDADRLKIYTYIKLVPGAIF
jgi:hypothetical protein